MGGSSEASLIVSSDSVISACVTDCIDGTMNGLCYVIHPFWPDSRGPRVGETGCKTAPCIGGALSKLLDEFPDTSTSRQVSG